MKSAEKKHLSAGEVERALSRDKDREEVLGLRTRLDRAISQFKV
jgi:hypothetical protein